MKVILSRKGFDSASGGCPSPIVDGRPISLPIPANGSPSPTRYGDLAGEYGALVTDLTRGRLTAESACHCDPDIVDECLPRSAGWQGALGQCHAAQSHLANQGVAAGDLFLFFGLFQPALKAAKGWKFYGQPEHRIWGWLQIDEIVNLGPDGSHAAARYAWLEAHPHVRAGWSSPNYLYIASEELALDGIATGLRGWGVLDRGCRLTAPNSQLTCWNIPGWLNPLRDGTGMTYHKNLARWTPDHQLRAVGRGQEFVADIGERADAREWIANVLKGEGR